MTTARIIRLLPATSLPCSIYNPITNTICGKPASAAYASELVELANSPTAGRWIIQPVCRDCAVAAKKVYEQ